MTAHARFSEILEQQQSMNKSMSPFLNAVKDNRTYWELEDRTAIMFTLEDKPGILLQALNSFTKNNLNLTRIQSKPTKQFRDKRLFEFYADFEGTLKDLNV